MFATHAGRVPAEADLVCYWFEKAGQQIAAGKATRARECVATLERLQGHASSAHLRYPVKCDI